MDETAKPVSKPPFVTVTIGERGEEIQTNIPPTQRPMIYWLLARAQMIVLTQLSEQEKSTLVNPTDGMRGFLRKMSK